MWAPRCSTPSAPGEPQVERLAVRTQHLRQGGERRVHLRVAVRRGAHDGGVQAERDVVHEHVTVDVGQVHRPLDGLAVAVERADDVVTVEAEVECEVVPRAGRHDDHRQPHLGRHGADHRLGTVAAGHAEDVDAAGGHVPHHLKPVLPRLQHHGLGSRAACTRPRGGTAPPCRPRT